MKPAVVVAAFNRPEALRRLLDCLAQADYPPDVPLVISIDPGGDRQREVCAVAEAFDWRHGDRRLIVHPDHLGLVAHVHFTASLSQQYGSIIRLEDDYYVSPAYYSYASQALDAYADDPRIAGISLYQLWFNGYSHLPFSPLLDAGDAYFLQIPWSQGQAYTAEQWARYVDWRESAGSDIPADGLIHEVYSTFPRTDWFPLATRYLAETSRFYVFPRESLSVNFGDAGTHFDRRTDYFQTPLQMFRRDFRFQPFDGAHAVYDSFLEILPDRLNRLAPRLAGYDYAVDLYGAKSPARLRQPCVLTTRPCRSPILSYGSALRPLEANIAAGFDGPDIALCRTADLHTDWLSSWRHRKKIHDYFMQRHTSSRRVRVLYWLVEHL